MEVLFDLGTVTLTIPAWQMVLYVGVVAFYMIWGRVKGCLMATYAFALYWGYYHYSRDFLNVANGNPGAQSAYYGFGMALIGFALFALFYEER